VKTEFGKFSEHLKKVHEQVNRASTSLDTLRSTRANAMERKLRGVQSLEVVESVPELLDIPDTDKDDKEEE
jgi:DNA recombination protein RmuC